MSLHWLIIGSVLAYLAGSVLHEATHYVTAWAFHLRPAFGISARRRIYVEHDSHDQLVDAVVHLAPVFVGLIIAIGWILNWPLELSVPLIIGWVSYTLLGLPNDIRFQAIEDESTA